MQRIDVLDVLRGLALLGLPLMNLVAFSMPYMAYNSPQAFHGENGVNHFWFSLFYIFADQKFMGIFSVLFGAGLILLYEKFKSEHNPVIQRGSGTIYIRLLILLGFGYLHGHYLWSGDILFFYAAWGMALFPFMGASVKGLTIGFFLLYGITLISASYGAAIDPELLSVQVQQQISHLFNPGADQIAYMIEVYHGTRDDINTFESTFIQDGQELSLAAIWPLFMESLSAIFRAGSMMLLGLLLYKNGFLIGAWSKQTYKWVARFGITSGVTISVLGLLYNYSHGYQDAFKYFGIGNSFVLISSPLMVVGYIALVQVLLKSAKSKVWSQALAKVGRMALSLYLMQSVIGVYLFWGMGLSWYGQVDRTELVMIAVAIGVVQITLATWWLTYFRYGPMEWLWRSLAYRSFEGFIRRESTV